MKLKIPESLVEIQTGQTFSGKSAGRLETTSRGRIPGYKFMSYLHQMDDPHKTPTTIYGTTQHLRSLDVT